LTRNREQLEKLAEEVVEAGGEASVWVGEHAFAAEARERFPSPASSSQRRSSAISSTTTSGGARMESMAREPAQRPLSLRERPEMGARIAAPQRAIMVCAVGLSTLISWSVGTLTTQAHAQASATTILVTMTDSKLRLQRAIVPVGTVVFRVVNKGRTRHDFRIGGHRTRTIAAGKTATLKVDFAKPGGYPYGSGRRASAGELSVFRPCPDPASSTISAEMTTGKITLSQTSVPCGTVTFVVTNTDKGPGVHQFAIDLGLLRSVPARNARIIGPYVTPGQTARLTVTFNAKGKVYYFCNVSEHDEQGEEFGYLSLT